MTKSFLRYPSGMTRAVKSFLRYPGGKTRLVPEIIPHIEAGLVGASVYHEVFLGGGSVAIAVAERFPQIDLQLNDADPTIAALWQVVVGSRPEFDNLMARVRTTHPTVALFQRVQNSCPTDRDGLAFKALLLNRCAYSGISTSGPLGGWAQSGKYKIGSRWNGHRLREQLQNVRTLLHDRTTVSCMDWEDFLDLGTIEFAYLDPPYIAEGPRLYPQPMGIVSHRRLRSYLRGLPNWLLSYDNHAEVIAMYAECDRFEVAATYALSRERKFELLITPKRAPIHACKLPNSMMVEFGPGADAIPKSEAKSIIEVL